MFTLFTLKVRCAHAKGFALKALIVHTKSFALRSVLHNFSVNKVNL